MKILLLMVTFFTLVGLFSQAYAKTQNLANVVTPSMTLKEWLKFSAVEIVANLLLFTAMCLGINVGLAEKVSEIATSDTSSAFAVQFGGAVAAGTLIYKTVQFTILPLWNSLTGAVTANKALREKIAGDR